MIYSIWKSGQGQVVDTSMVEGSAYLATSMFGMLHAGAPLDADEVLSRIGFSAADRESALSGEFVTATATKIENVAYVGRSDELAYGSTSEFAANFAITSCGLLAEQSAAVPRY